MRGILTLLLVVVMAALTTQCRKNSFTDDSSAVLEFSMDTVLFDTVFNTVGSTTATLKVYNRNNQGVRTNISLTGGSQSQYRLNVNGLPGDEFTEVEIYGQDSIFIFVEVTVDPSDSLHPFVEDIIRFNTNGNEQKVNLLAWGWDAIFYTPNVFPTNGLPPYRIIDPAPNATTVWTPEKPIVIYGYAVVDEGDHLEIQPGTRIFMHAGSGLWVYKDGSITAEGTAEEPIVFQGDRLEAFYQDQPGQWDRIWINEGNQTNVLRHVIIKNSFIGIQAETLPFAGNETAPTSSNTLVIENCRIYNTSLIGLLARNYKIEAQNNLFYDSGQYLMAVSGGGEYRFNRCTFANYWNFSSRQTPLLLLTNAYENPPGVLQVRSIENTVFSNCIFYGNNDNELELAFDEDGVNIDITFKNSLVKYDLEVEDYSAFFGDSVFVNEFPGFINTFERNYRLSSGAFARDKGTLTPAVNFSVLTVSDLDIEGSPRQGLPDPGCFEFQP